MFQLYGKGSQPVRTETATRTTFCKILKQEMEPLYLLALLLTADPQLAEECFLATVEETFEDVTVFNDWALAWIKHGIVKHAVRRIFREPSRTGVAGVVWSFKGDGERTSPIDCLIQLSPLERFVFIMTSLEGYSLRKCAALLNRSMDELSHAKVAALRHMSSQAPIVSLDGEPSLSLIDSAYSLRRATAFHIPLPLATLSDDASLAS
jgi:DNA-directed RNA polymerase specialized sigma24 family protein